MANVTKTKTYKVGITGGPCCGKTTVRKLLTRWGLSVVDTFDILVTIATQRPVISQQIVRELGPGVLDVFGRLNPDKVEATILDDPAKKKFLNETVQGLVREEVKRFLYGPLGTFVRFVENPMLFESSSEHLYDEIWTIRTDPKMQQERLAQRDGISLEQAYVRIMSEMSQDEKAQMSTRVIDNSGDRVKTEQQVREAYDNIKNKAFTPRF